MSGGRKNKCRKANGWLSSCACFFGVLGIHKFYEGRVLLGIVYLLTLGMCGVGVVIDLVILLLKPNPYYP